MKTRGVTIKKLEDRHSSSFALFTTTAYRQSDHVRIKRKRDIMKEGYYDVSLDKLRMCHFSFKIT